MGNNYPTDGAFNPLSFLTPHFSNQAFELVGGARDGGYFLPADLSGIDLCISPGIGLSTAFERDLAERFGIKSVLIDGSVSADHLDLHPTLNTFLPLWLGPQSDKNTITLGDLVRAYPSQQDAILQMDIEGAEYEVLLGTDQTTLERFRYIIIELHNLDALSEGGRLREKICSALHSLSLSHRVFWSRANNCCGQFTDRESGKNVPTVMEVTLVRKDVQVTEENVSGQSRLSEESDSFRNDPRRGTLVLNSFWGRSYSPKLGVETRWNGSASANSRNSEKHHDVNLPFSILLPTFRSDLVLLGSGEFEELVWLPQNQLLSSFYLPTGGTLELKLYNPFESRWVLVSSKSGEFSYLIEGKGLLEERSILAIQVDENTREIRLSFGEVSVLADGRSVSVALTGAVWHAN